MKTKLTVLTLVLAQCLSAQLADYNVLSEQAKLDQTQIEELSKQVDYYKKFLNLSKVIRTSTFENIQIELNDIRGLKKEGKIMVEFTYKNMGAEMRKALQFEKAIIVEFEGNQYQTQQVFLTLDGKIRVNDLLHGIPYKGAMFFHKSNRYFPIIRALVLYIYTKDQLSNPEPIVFENIPVIWE
ncbi:hypothetical protein [Kaistella sp.]|uniref:hypothetical protein n=1 Tax=Kaistella sp. TaxID=2782235 RepID=UPI003C654599